MKFDFFALSSRNHIGVVTKFTLDSENVQNKFKSLKANFGKVLRKSFKWENFHSVYSLKSSFFEF